ncbi:hypothetical protein KKJ09_19435 [Xenorhabdus bovienii]|uniref:ClpX C4-type zinc finger protein n=1 Tax=Xenorhabdus bovienii TaxID=40576 RepID=UPI0023B33008|nr:ClpX C4-type zinc finger protein [Xenorhabdus bovienii]MDE9495695.1 hypothetical protein [Xenorhabdus bovienii]MDE9504098.1 hypothetical protein [Xenorhabdus bovienii]
MSLEIEKINAIIGCSFCGESNKGDRRFIVGRFGNICSSCVCVCVDILVSKADDSINCADKNTGKENATQTP